MSKYSKHLSLLAKFALMLLAFWFVARGVNMQEVKEMLRTQNRSAFFEAAALLALQVIVGAVRWRMVLVGLAENSQKVISSLSALKTYYISVFFNCCLPGTVGGDVIRVFLVKSEHTPLPLAISSVVIDRMIALLALAVMGAVTMPVLAGYLGISGWILTPLFILLIGFGFWILFHLDKIVLTIPFLKKLHWLENLVSNIRLMLIRPRPASASLAYAIFSHICYCLSVYVLAESFSSPVTLLEAVTLVPWVLLISIIPISIGGWGLREAAMVFLLGLAGVPQAVALTLSVQVGLLLIVVTIPAGFLWLMNRRRPEGRITGRDQ